MILNDATDALFWILNMGEYAIRWAAQVSALKEEYKESDQSDSIKLIMIINLMEITKGGFEGLSTLSTEF